MNICGCIARHVEDVRFHWQRRRYIWRASYYYNLMTCVLLIGIVLSFAFHYLITNFKFFMSYCCSARSIRTITYYIVLHISCTGGSRVHAANMRSAIILALAIFLGRVCNMLSNIIISDSMATDGYMHYLGCGVKWVPWGLAVLLVCMVMMHFSSLIWMFANSRQWCENRFNDAAVNAVRNCRLIVRGNVPCNLSIISGTHKEIRECNSPQYLVNKRLMLLALVDNASALSCSIEDPAVCNAFNDVFTGKYVDWKRAELRGCLGQVPENLDKFKDRGSSSDLYKYLMLYAISWAIVYVLFICFFYIMKRTTEFDAIIYQPKNPAENIVLRFTRPLTPWS
ncbi:membrane protein, putative [Babesia bigemina]|uniref:Membrane protein, putative n=1 Tax=Babesia bigemina TaxID=5866 RepID=A0A061DDV8_BABBI|nr:membrane protein, putative [Babesia bigemina]CDR97729.1 membrane protein, putative [Babesia bigemina]|eukprot:XP_012769915.1 membrane protein, putative [Babesia bigemina]